MSPSRFRCASVNCPGTHALPTHRCKSVTSGGTGVFACARIHPPCAHHARATHVCRDSGDAHAWSCGRVEPPCPGHATRRANVRCGAGTWRCGRVEPPCVGHRRPGLVCEASDVASVPLHGTERAPRTLSVGVNLPWSFTYCGYDFGVPPRTWRARHPSPRKWDDELGPLLDTIAGLGLEVVRFWVLADGVAYPEGDPITRWVTLKQASDTKTVEVNLRANAVEPPSLSDTFVDDVRGLLDALHARGLRAIPSFVSFEAFEPGAFTKDGTLKQGRRSLLLGKDHGADPAWIDRMLAGTLGRLVAIPGPNGERTHPAVLAWEAVNEPDWPVRHGYVDAVSLSLFLERAIEVIVRAGHCASIGFVDDAARWVSPSLAIRLRDLASDERYLHQLHYYPRFGSTGCRPEDATEFPGATIVGEMSMSDAPSARWRDDFARATEPDPSRYLEGRLECLDRLGYSLALLWSVNAGDDKSGWDEDAKRQIRAFTARPKRAR